jgi:hypothetical protein
MNRPRTEAQIAASRANGALSHGPVTEEGKKIAQSNNLKHGLLSNTILVPGESEEMFDELLADRIREFDPQTGSEMSCVQAMVVCLWRQMRTWGLTAAGQTLEILRQAEGDPEAAALPMAARNYLAITAINKRDNGLNTLHRYETGYYRQYSGHLRNLLALKQARLSAAPKDADFG